MDTLNWRQDLPAQQLQSLLDGETDAPSTRPFTQAWGYFLRLDAGLGYFSWFPNQERMLAYLVLVEMLHAPESLPDRAAYLALTARLREVAQNFLNDGDAQRAQTGFNQVFPDFQLHWLGTFAELQAGSDPFSCELIRAYGREPADDPDFAAFCEHYGL